MYIMCVWGGGGVSMTVKIASTLPSFAGPSN